MNKKILVGIVIAVIILGYYLISPVFNKIEINESLPESSIMQEIVAEGSFTPATHEVSGKAILISAQERNILRFEDFKTINGPDLHIYLSTDLEATDYIDLGEIKGTKGNINYDVPEGIDIEKYNKVLVWCEPFRVLFSSAELKK